MPPGLRGWGQRRVEGIAGIGFLSFPCVEHLAPGTAQTARFGHVILDRGCQSGKVVAGDTGIHVMFGVPVHMPVVIANLTPCEQDALVTLPIAGGSFSRQGDGSELPMQPIEDGLLVECPGLQPYSLNWIASRDGTGRNPDDRVSARHDNDTLVLENSLLRVEFDRLGQIQRLHDREKCREVLETGIPGNALWVFVDRPIAWDAWDIDVFVEDQGEPIVDLEAMQIVENGPLRAVIRVDRRYRRSRIVQHISLRRNSRRLDFATRVEWNEHHILLKAAFAVSIRSSRARYEIQWGDVERSTHVNTSWDFAKFEVAAHKWVDLSEPDYGVALLNDCKYGHDVRANVMRISLIRSPTMPDPGSDIGTHRFTYSLLPHAGDTRIEVRREACDLNNPPLVRAARSDDGPLPGSVAASRAPNVVIEAIKPSENADGFILRLHEAEGMRGMARVTFGMPVARVTACDLLENDQEEMETCGKGITFEINPYQILTLRIRPA